MGRFIGMISNTTDLSDHEVVSHQEWLKASADFSGQGEGVHPLAGRAEPEAPRATMGRSDEELCLRGTGRKAISGGSLRRTQPVRCLSLHVDATAWRHGLRLGLHCSHCYGGLMAILLVIGVMDLRAMAVVAAAITVAPAGERVARAIGAVVVGAGVFLIVRA